MSGSLDQFGKSLVASGLFTAEELKALWAGVAAQSRPRDGEGLAGLLVAQGKLTEFQAQHVLSSSSDPLVLNDYVLIDKIGAGGMGQVFKAQHKRLKRLAAVKLLPPDLVRDASSVKRFQREVEAAGRVSHSNVVQTYDAGECRGRHYLVMEYVAGSDLASLVRRHGPLPVDHAVSCVLQAARGLEHAHGRGLIHRDIKPANLLIDDRGTVKVLDLGLARFEDVLGAGEDDGLTGTGSIMGTVDYMSPEQAMDTKHADARADIYSLGCALYFLLTARKPYDADTVMKRLMAHREAPIPSLRDARSDIPAAVEDVYRRMMAKSPKERFQTMEEVCGALEACLPEAKSTLGETSKQERSGISGESSGLRAFLSNLSNGIGSTAVNDLPRVITESGETHGSHNPLMHTLSGVAGGNVAATVVRRSATTRTFGHRRYFFAAATAAVGILVAGLLMLLKPPRTPDGETPVAAIAAVEVAVLKPRKQTAAVDLLPLFPEHGDQNARWSRDAGIFQHVSRNLENGATTSTDWIFPEEYDLKGVVERTEGTGGLIIGLSAGAAQFQLMIEEGSDRRTELAWVDGRAVRAFPASPLFVTGRKQTLEVRVRRDGVSATCDGRKFVDFVGSLTRLSRAQRLPERSAFLGTSSNVRIHELSLQPVSELPIEPGPANVAGGEANLAGDRAIVEWARSNGATVSLATATNPLLELAPGAEIPAGEFKVERLSFAEPRDRLTDDDLVHLTGLTSLKKLHISSSKISDRGLDHVRNIRDLVDLELWYCGITDDGVAKLESLPLRLLVLRSTPSVTGAALKSVVKIKTLSTLRLSALPISNSDIPQLQTLPALGLLGLHATKITDDGLTALSTFPTLNFLDVSYTAVSDVGLARLAKISQLRRLRIDGLTITDEGVLSLTQNKNLAELWVAKAKITSAVLDQLRTALPNCNVHFEDKVPE